MSFLSNCKYYFSSDNINIITLLYDTSGSMEDHCSKMRAGLKAFKKDFEKFEERGAIAISRGNFDSSFEMTPFREVANFNTNYYTGGSTHLYYAISKAVDLTVMYYNELVRRLNTRPRITFLVFTDGEDTGSPGWGMSDAINAIAQLNELDATTVFVAFDRAIDRKDGETLGFNCIKNVENANDLIECLGEDLSKSCQAQSRSAISLGSQFFSKAAAQSGGNTASAGNDDDDFFGW